MSRVSNEQILTALTDLPAAIAAAMGNTTREVPNMPTKNTTEGSDEGTENIPIDGAYLAHVSGKLQDRANADKQTYVLYARKNVAGETKLAYCLGSKWTGLTDRRIIGAVKTVSPE